MQLRNGSLFFSPTDLVNFLGCSHAAVLDFRQLSEPPQPRTFSETDQLLALKGQEHEAAYLRSLRDAGKTVAEIPKGLSLEDRIALTGDALNGGVDVVYQAALSEGHWGGFPDFLVKTDRPTGLGSFSYEVLDTKLARRPEPQHVIQVAIYSDLL